MARYKIIRFSMNGPKRTICTGLSIEQAQAVCRDPETSSETCTNARGRKLTKRLGPWFYGYTGA